MPRLRSARADGRPRPFTLIAVSFAATPAAHASDQGPVVPVIVEASSVADATTAVTAVGGTVDLALPVVGGVAAHVRAGALRRSTRSRPYA